MKNIYEQKSKIIKYKKDPNVKAEITHWDHFYVNRNTGMTWNNVFTASLLTPMGDEPIGQRFVGPCSCVGGDEESNDWIWEVQND